MTGESFSSSGSPSLNYQTESPLIALMDEGGATIGPSTFTLANLNKEEFETIVRAVPGGVANVEDIYPLSPLQEGMLFHRLLNRDSDTYVLSTLIEIRSLAKVEALVAALQKVVERHDILRTAILWEGLRTPLQVVYRRAALQVTRLRLDDVRDVDVQLKERMRPVSHVVDMNRSPMMTLEITTEAYNDKYYAVLRVHHVVCDHQSLNMIVTEALSLIGRKGSELSSSRRYRGYIEEVLKSERQWDSEAFFRDKLADVEEATTPFGIIDVHGDGCQIDELRSEVELSLARRVRAQALAYRVTPARFFHAAWALVVARTSGCDDIVFGTVLLAAAQRGASGALMLGLAVNTLPLRMRLQGLSAEELLAHADQELRLLSSHEHSPLALAQRCSGIAATSPLFTAILNFRRSTTDPQQASNHGIQVVGRGEAWTNYPITMIVDDLGDAFSLITQTDRRIDPNRLTAYFRTAIESLVSALEQNPHTRALGLAVLPQAEWHRLVKQFNATQAAYPQGKLLHQLFEEQVDQTPHAVALVCADQYLTYKQLNGRANQLARYLRLRGARPDRFVGLCVERGVEMIVGMLGILKSGAAYVPLDPNYPKDRLEYMLRQTTPIVVVTMDGLKNRLPGGARTFSIDVDWAGVGAGSVTNPSYEGLSSNALAYVIYTSGSTGQPKGVTIEHRSAVNMVHWARSAFSAEVFDETLQSTSLNFDLSVYECFVPLVVGGCLRIVQNALSLVHERFGVTLINTVPSAIKAILDSAGIPKSTRVINLAGEALSESVVDRIFENSAVDCVCNLYGPSETTTYSTYVAMLREDGFNSSVGRPVANTQIYILDQHHQIAPVGVAGQIHIGGVGVARGYLNRPELTAQRFIADPFGTQTRIYATGDVGRWRDDGTIEYLGRNDGQVKIRGFRIELGEVEGKLIQHPQIREAVVIASTDTFGEKRLVAYVVPMNSSSVPNIGEVRVSLKAVLPDYMVPSAFVLLERIPLSPNGKIDRNALPQPDWEVWATQQYEEPEGEIEQILAGIWQEILGIEKVGRQSNFFELGGHSLLIVHLMERLRRVGLSTELRRVFECPTLKGLAATLTNESIGRVEVPENGIPPGCEMIMPGMLPLIRLDQENIEHIAQRVAGGSKNIQDIYPLAPLQEGILFHHLMNDQGKDTYVLPFVFSVSSEERVSDLVAAIQGVIDRHDVLRTAILWEELPQAVQVVYRQAVLPVERLVLEPDVMVEDHISGWMKPERQHLNLRQAPLMKLQVAASAKSRELYVLLQLHHIILDHTTLEVLTAEIVAHLENRAKPLAASVPYRNHVATALYRARIRDADAFFRRKLGDVDEPTAPFGLMNVHGDGSEVEEAHERLDSGVAQQVRSQARRLGVSPAALFHAAWSLVVAHCSGRSDVVFGTLLLGRLQDSWSTSPALGVFINTLPLRLKLRGITTKFLIEETQRELVELLSYEQASLASAQRCSGMPGSTPLFSALLNYRHSVSSIEEQWNGASGIRMLAFKERTNYPITVSVDDLGEEFTLTAHTDRRVDPERVTAYLRTAVQSLVHALEQAPETSALMLPIVPRGEFHQLVEQFNATDVSYPEEKLVHQLFEEQAARMPNAVAAMYEDQSLTYSRLDRLADRLAQRLIGEGIGPDQLVGICVERSLAMIVGLLGILKAGGAYVPLDPSYPVERLHYMITDAAPRVVLTQKQVRSVLPATEATIIELDGLLETLDESSGEAALETDRNSTARNLVYVIYTSGSTGRPKGTAMSHRSMVNLIEWHRNSFRNFEGRRVLQFAALSFDVAFQEIFSTLCTGGTLMLLDEWIRRDTRALIEFLNDQAIDRLFVPPLMLQSLAECSERTGASPRGLKDVITAGEQLRITSEIVSLFKRLKPCRLHNHYGPTETHVVTTLTLPADPETWPVTPTIGQPIDNCRIQILDGQRQLVPMGVVGEIYVAGANVARGYHNRCELTADRFVCDSVGSDAGGRLYKTGDLGRWQADGSIRYLGRNDDQVKIRGYRIELGEIEAELTKLPEVAEAAVIAREEGPGGKRLVAYVVGQEESEPSIEDLRAQLKGVLPEYMVPGSFVILKALPRTPSGKLDRRALPAPIATFHSDQYEPPQGETEEAIAKIWRDLLQADRISRGDNFFELGGHSLLAMSALFKINEACASSLRVTDLYMSPTIRELAVRMSGSSREDDVIDLAREARLSGEIIALASSRPVPSKMVLLTGATGFVGRFLLAQLLEDTHATICCLVRAQSPQQASARLRTMLQAWDLWRDEYDSRIIAVPGDLRLPGLGLDENTYQTLSREVDSIYHCGTSMNHLETYAMAKPANVDSARELVKLATNKRPKIINYISTMSIFKPLAVDPDRVVDETSSIDHERHRQSNGYAASKWVGERIFMTANERGIPCNILRVGFVWADAKMGRYDELQRGYRVLKSSLLSGYGMKGFRYHSTPTPVDYAARAVVHLAESHSNGGGIFHISATRETVGDLFEKCNALVGTSLELLTPYEWVQEMRRLHHEGRTLPIVPLVEATFSMDEEAFYESERRFQTDNVPFSCVRTHEELERAGISAPLFDDELLRRGIESMVSRDADFQATRRDARALKRVI